MKSTRKLLIALVVAFTPVAALTAAEEPERPRVEIATSMGTIVLELRPDKAPLSVKNFLDYAENGFYKGTIFHRVIPNFMVQGGGFDSDLNLRPPAGMITNEADNGLSNKRGTVAMARRNEPHSATSQFYINHVDNKGLDHKAKYDGATWGYAVFGQVVEGMDVVDAIAATPTQRGPKGMTNLPRETVVIQDVIWVNAPPSDEPTVTLDGGAG